MERMLTQDCVDQLNLKDGISGYHTPLESLMVGELDLSWPFVYFPSAVAINVKLATAPTNQIGVEPLSSSECVDMRKQKSRIDRLSFEGRTSRRQSNNNSFSSFADQSHYSSAESLASVISAALSAQSLSSSVTGKGGGKRASFNMRSRTPSPSPSMRLGRIPTVHSEGGIRSRSASPAPPRGSHCGSRRTSPLVPQSCSSDKASTQTSFKMPLLPPHGDIAKVDINTKTDVIATPMAPSLKSKPSRQCSTSSPQLLHTKERKESSSIEFKQVQKGNSAENADILLTNSNEQGFPENQNGERIIEGMCANSIWKIFRNHENDCGNNLRDAPALQLARPILSSSSPIQREELGLQSSKYMNEQRKENVPAVSLLFDEYRLSPKCKIEDRVFFMNDNQHHADTDSINEDVIGLKSPCRKHRYEEGENSPELVATTPESNGINSPIKNNEKFMLTKNNEELSINKWLINEMKGLTGNDTNMSNNGTTNISKKIFRSRQNCSSRSHRELPVLELAYPIRSPSSVDEYELRHPVDMKSKEQKTRMAQSVLSEEDKLNSNSIILDQMRDMQHHPFFTDIDAVVSQSDQTIPCTLDDHLIRRSTEAVPGNGGVSYKKREFRRGQFSPNKIDDEKVRSKTSLCSPISSAILGKHRGLIEATVDGVLWLIFAGTLCALIWAVSRAE